MIEIDKKLSTDKITPELIDYIIQKIVKAIDPEKIILFSSYARGIMQMIVIWIYSLLKIANIVVA